MLQESKREEACVYVRTSFDTYSDRHVLDCMLLCAAVIALLCFAVLAVQRQHTYSYILLLYCSAVKQQLLYTVVPPATLAHKEAWIGITDTYKVDGPTI